jgi:predicted nucleic acid-binding protein
MKEYNCFIDSNIFLRTLLRDEEKTFRDCVGFLNEVKKGKIKAFTSNLILAEINWTLLRFYKFPKEEIIKGLYSILKLKNLKFIDKFDSNLTIEIYKKFSIKFIDALIASNPQIYQKKAIVVSYDRDFDKIGIIRKEPKDLIKK